MSDGAEKDAEKGMQTIQNIVQGAFRSARFRKLDQYRHRMEAVGKGKPLKVDDTISDLRKSYLQLGGAPFWEGEKEAIKKPSKKNIFSSGELLNLSEAVTAINLLVHKKAKNMDHPKFKKAMKPYVHYLGLFSQRITQIFGIADGDRVTEPRGTQRFVEGISKKGGNKSVVEFYQNLQRLRGFLSGNGYMSDNILRDAKNASTCCVNLFEQCEKTLAKKGIRVGAIIKTPDSKVTRLSSSKIKSIRSR